MRGKSFHLASVLLVLALVMLTLALSTAGMANKPSKVKDIFTLDVCPSTVGHPRNDWPFIFPLKDGGLMLVWCEYYATKPSHVTTKKDRFGDAASCRISAKISTDRGRNWSDTFTLQDNIGNLNVKHPNLLRLPSDEILFFFTVRNSQRNDIRIYMKRSQNECETWSEAVQVSSLKGVHFLTAGRVLQMSSGRIVLPCHYGEVYGRGDHYQSFCYYSDDEGRTWHISEGKMDLPKRGAEEPSIVQLNNGSLLAVVRTSLGAVYKGDSPDGGENWTKPVSTGIKAPASAPLLKRIPSTGDLLLICNHPDKPSGHGPRNPLTAAISEDEGETWGNIRDIEDTPGASLSTPGATFFDNEALVTYYRGSGGWRGTSIRLKIIPIDWFCR